MTVKNYLETENARNKANADLYSRMIRLAFGDKDQIMIAHHLTFETDNNLQSVNEIPSADTLIFDHYAMGQIFGSQAKLLMGALAQMPVDERDAALEQYVGAAERLKARQRA